jgi:L-amino acid N-acyltransferase
MADVRDATAADLEGILAIYNDVIATSTAVYRDDPVTLDDRRAWWVDRTAHGYPVLVAVDGIDVVGFATFGDFRAGIGYRHTVEHTVHVRADRRGHGVGATLMRSLLARAVLMRRHVMIGGVDGDNEASIRFHERLGFSQAARLHQVGYKFGRWLDLVFVERLL